MSFGGVRESQKKLSIFQVSRPVQSYTANATPSDQLRATVTPVSLTIGGVPAPIFFSGLTPGLSGLYQVNA